MWEYVEIDPILELIKALCSFCVDFSLALHLIISESSAVRSIFYISNLEYCIEDLVNVYLVTYGFFLPFNVGLSKLLSISKLSPYWKLFKQVDTVLKSKKHLFFFSLFWGFKNSPVEEGYTTVLDSQELKIVFVLYGSYRWIRFLFLLLNFYR